jgi:hypothetical protein
MKIINSSIIIDIKNLLLVHIINSRDSIDHIAINCNVKNSRQRSYRSQSHKRSELVLGVHIIYNVSGSLFSNKRYSFQ